MKKIYSLFTMLFFALSLNLTAQETVIAVYDFVDGATTGVFGDGVDVTAASLGYLKNGDQSSATDANSVICQGRGNEAGAGGNGAGFSASYLTGLDLTPADLVDGKLHVSISLNNIDLSSASGNGKFQFYLKGSGPASAAGHRFMGLILTDETGGGTNDDPDVTPDGDIKITSTIFNGGQYGVNTDIGGLTHPYNEPINVGVTMDFINFTTSFWVGSPGANPDSPFGLTMDTSAANQSTAWNEATITNSPDAILKQLQFNIVSGTGSIEIDQFKISTGTYENTVAAGDGETTAPSPDLALQGVIDFSLPGKYMKAVHVKATADIADLSVYSIESYSSTPRTEPSAVLPLSGSASAGDDILFWYSNAENAANLYMNASGIFDVVVNDTAFNVFNGDDPLTLSMNGTVVETYGELGVDGTGEAWEYLDTWAYKVDGAWTYGAVNCTDGSYFTWDSGCAYPLAVGQQATGASTDLVTAFSEDMNVVPSGGFWYNEGEAPIERKTASNVPGSDTSAMMYTDDGSQAYSNMQIQFTSKVDMSSMNTFTVDVYVDGTTTTGTAPVNLALKLQDSSEGTPWTNQNVVIQDITADTWTTLTFAFNDDASMSRDDVDRIVVQFNGEGNNDQVTAYMRNMVGSYTEPVADAAPAVAAPTPTQAAEDVMSILSTHYTAGVVINEVNPDWGQQTILTEVELNGDPLWKMSDLNYQGQNLATTDISTMEYVHVDVWSENGEAFNFFLLDAGSPEVSQAITPTAGGAWHSVDIPLADYDAVRELVRTNLVQLKWDGTVSLMYIGNLYFWKNPTAAGDTCDHTFVMNDSYGDSWNGSSVDILVNGVVVVEGAAAANAGVNTGSTENLLFQAATGDVISLGNWVTGTYTTEVSWEILDNEGTSLASGNHGADASVDGYCTPPAECDHTFVMNDSYGDSWNGSSVDILVDGVVVIEGAAAVAGSGGATTENLLFNAVEGSSITLANWVTGTYTGEVSWVILDGTGEELASGNHGDVADVTANCTLPDCLTPTDLTVSDITTTGALLSWVSEGSQFMIEIQPAGSPQGTEGGYTVGDIDPYPLTYVDLTGFLADNTAYDIYVINVCDSSNSAWAGPASFTTLALPIVPDYTNDFTEFPGDLWSSGSPTGSFASAWTADGFANDGTTGAAKTNIYSSNNIQVLESPIFDLTGGTFYLNMKAAVTAWNGTDALAMGSDDTVTVSVSVDGAEYVVLHTWNESNNPGPTGTNMPEVDLTGYSSANVKFAITMNDGTANDPEDYDFFVDDFSVGSTSLGVDDIETLQFSFFPNPVNNILTIKAQASIDSITVYNMLGQAVVTSTPNTNNSTVDMSALQTGAYFVKVSINNTLNTIRVIKN